MKKVILCFTMLLTVMFANAQKSEGFAKGNVYITGGIGFSATDNAGVSSNTFRFFPAVGYFVSNNFALGAKLGIISESESDVKTNTTAFAVFGRYFFTPQKKFTVIGNIGIDYSTEKVNSNQVGTNKIEFAVSPHVNYCLSNHFSMEAGFGRLAYSNKESAITEGTSTFDLDLDLRAVSFGLTYKF